MIYVGIDLSKAKFDASCVVEKLRDRVFSNDLEGFEKFTTWLAPHPVHTVHICMEGTGRLWEPLAEYLTSLGYYISVVNPLRIKGFADSELRRSKTDKIDARIIARFCKASEPPQWQAPDPQTKRMRDFRRHVESLKEDHTRQINRLKSGILDPAINESIQSNLKYLKQEIKKFEKQIEEMIKTAPELASAKKIMSIISVGQVLASTLVGELGSIQRFKKCRDIEIFCGVAPRVFESGSSVRGKTRLSKRCNSKIRKVLYMASLSGMQHNPHLREFADRLRTAKKPGKVIVCAVARKLLRIIFAVMRSGQDYDPAFKSAAPA